MNRLPDEQLMLAFGTGDQDAFATLYQRHKGPLYRYLLRQLGSGQRARAEELFQEVWYRVVDKRADYAPSARFTTWLYHMARNLVIDEQRRLMTAHAALQQADGEPAVWPVQPLPDEKRAIQECVSLLAPLQREAFVLRYDSGFDPAQICSIVDAKPQAVKTRLRYALAQLRDCLSRKLGER